MSLFLLFEKWLTHISLKYVSYKRFWIIINFDVQGTDLRALQLLDWRASYLQPIK